MNSIGKKYNRLFKEMALYYHLDHKVTTSASSRHLHFIKIRDFGYTEFDATTASMDHADNILSHLLENFPYLAPFYKFFHNDHFCQPGLPDSNLSLLKDINMVMKQIRKENEQTVKIK